MSKRGTELSVGNNSNHPGGNYTHEEVEFIKAVRTYINKTGRKFPQFTEVLAVAKSLGYRKVLEPEPCEGT